MANAVLTETELTCKVEERVQILKRLRELLLTQREKFHNYLKLLEKENIAIERGDIESLESQSQLEKSLIREISTFQRVIIPMENLYHQMYPSSERTIPTLQMDLDVLRGQILENNVKNQALLDKKMSLVRQEIKSLRRPFAAKSPFSRQESPSFIDVSS